MSNIELSKQEFEGQSLRVALIDGDPWFASLDVGTALGFDGNGISYHVRAAFAEDESVR